MKADPSAAGDEGRLRIFISYCRDDVAIADQIHATLVIGGYEPLIDREGIEVGEDWELRLKNLLRSADTVLVLLSPSWAESPACRAEIDWALVDGKRIIPVICRSLGTAQPHPAVAALNYIFIYSEARKPGTGFGAGLLELREALNSDLGWLREHTRLLERASEWHSARRPSIRLLSGTDIDAAKQWAARRPSKAPALTALHREFIQASEDEEQRRQSIERQRLEHMAAAQADREAALVAKEQAQLREARQARRVVQITLAGLVVALALAATATWFGYSARTQQHRAERALGQVRANAQAWVEQLVAHMPDQSPALQGTAAREDGTPALDTEALQRLAEKAEMLLEGGKFVDVAFAVEDPLRRADVARAAFASDPAAQIALIRLHRTAGLAALRQGDTARRGGTRHLDCALELSRNLADVHADYAGAREALAVALQDAGELWTWIGSEDVETLTCDGDSVATPPHGFERAEQLLRQLLALRQADRSASPDTAATAVELAAALNRLAELERARGDFKSATGHVDQSLSLLEKQPFTAGPRRNRELSLAYYIKSEVAVANEAANEAVTWLKKDVELSRRLAQAQPTDAEAWHSLSTSLDALYRQRETTEQPQHLLALLKEASQHAERAFELSGRARPEWLHDAAGLLFLQAEMLGKAGQPDASLAAHERSLVLRVQAVELGGLAGRHDDFIQSWRATRRLLLKLGRVQQVKDAAEQQLFWTALLPCFEDRSTACSHAWRAEAVADALAQLSWTALVTGDADRALWAAQRATVLWPDLQNARLNLAHAMMLTGRRDKALEAYRAGLLLPRREEDEEDWQTHVLKDLADLRKHGIHHDLMAEVDRLFKPTPSGEHK